LNRDTLDVRQHPRFVEQRFLRAIQTEENLKFSASLVGTQFDSLPAGALGPKYTSTDPSAFFCRPGLSEERLTVF
jgi:hypothetical protein